MAKFLLIRHGKTAGNAERRYIGDPEEPICEEGLKAARELAQSGVLPPVEAVFSSTALRCRQTAEILFPGARVMDCALSEIDFGLFKGKTADELKDDDEYAAWLETGCMGDIPGGGSVSAFKNHCCEVFQGIAAENRNGTTAMVVHGGNIMAILERFALPKKDFYDYHVPNLGRFLCRLENGGLIIECEAL